MKIKIIGRNNASCLIKSNYTTLIDIERDLFKFVSTQELKNLDNIILTHGHIHAIESIPDLAAFLNQHGRLMVNLYATPSLIKLIKLRYNEIRNTFNFIEIRTAKRTYKIGDLEIKPVKVNHDPHYPTYAYRINKCMFWGPSMAPDWDQYDIRHMSNNILACFDGREWNEDSNRHLSIVYSFSQISKLNNKYTLFVGAKGTNSQANQTLQSSLDSYKKENPSAYNKNIRVSKAVESFSINMDKLKERTGEVMKTDKQAQEEYTVKCSKCSHEFNYLKEPEAGMGYVKCPKCRENIDQEGRAMDPSQANSAVKYIKWQIRSPKEVTKVHLKALSKDEGINLLVGSIKLDLLRTIGVQSVLFNTKQWTVEEARVWIGKHQDKLKSLKMMPIK